MTSSSKTHKIAIWSHSTPFTFRYQHPTVFCCKKCSCACCFYCKPTMCLLLLLPTNHVIAVSVVIQWCACCYCWQPIMCLLLLLPTKCVHVSSVANQKCVCFLNNSRGFTRIFGVLLLFTKKNTLCRLSQVITEFLRVVKLCSAFRFRKITLLKLQIRLSRCKQRWWSQIQST